MTSPRSRGRLRLESADPATQPGRTPAFYDEPSDLEPMKTGLRALLLIAGREPLVHFLNKPFLDPSDHLADARLPSKVSSFRP